MTAFAEVVSVFAASLDAEDYQTTQSCLAEHCVYDSPNGDCTGPAAIIGSYKDSGDRARELFDSVGYRHNITALDDGWFQIEFVDELQRGQKSHVFRCHQRVRLENGRIVHIVHEEIPGQRDLLNAFLESIA